MTAEQAEALRRLAAERNVSQSSLVREALDELVNGDVRTRRIERARRAVGSGASGESTTSVDHDRALDDALSV